MRVLIAGGGEVASHIAHRLIREGNEIVIVEESASRCSYLEEAFDARIVRGSAASPRVLNEAGLADAEMLIAVTGEDEVNLLACLIAETDSSVKVKVARLRTHEYEEWRRICEDSGMKIDLIIHPESEAVSRILPVLRVPGVSGIVDFADGQVTMFGMLIERDHWTVGKSLIEIATSGAPRNLLVAVIFRGSEVIIPRGDERILAGDHVYVLTRSQDIEEVFDFVGLRRQERLERAFILGGKQIGILLAEELEKQGVNVKLFEKDRDRCRKISELLAHTIVVHGDGMDATTLIEENVRDIGAYMALTDDDEDNLIASLLARRLGAKKVVALINRLNYLPLGQRLGINASVSPRLATVDRILRFVRRGQVVSVTTLGDEAAEAIELVASSRSRYVGKKLMEMRLPRGAIVGAVARSNGEVIVPRGHSTIEADDRVIFFALESVVPQLESAFLAEARRGRS